jgi:hypothetical protein
MQGSSTSRRLMLRSELLQLLLLRRLRGVSSSGVSTLKQQRSG